VSGRFPSEPSRTSRRVVPVGRRRTFRSLCVGRAAWADGLQQKPFGNEQRNHCLERSFGRKFVRVATSWCFYFARYKWLYYLKTRVPVLKNSYKRLGPCSRKRVRRDIESIRHHYGRRFRPYGRARGVDNYGTAPRTRQRGTAKEIDSNSNPSVRADE